MNVNRISHDCPIAAEADAGMLRTSDSRTWLRRIARQLSLALFLACGAGCSTVDCLKGIESVPAHRIPRSVMGRPREDMLDISLARLRQTPPPAYLLGPNDVLGVYIENVLGKPEEAPPVNFPESGTRAPSIGYPIPIREDGTLALPLVEPIPVKGMTLEQATLAVRTAYTKTRQILPEGKDRIIVTLQRPRMHRVMVVRQEENTTIAANGAGSTKRGTGETIDLPAYENDLLHALNETGGLPGLDAENEVLIIKGGIQDAAQHDAMVAQIAASKGPCECPPVLPDAPNVIRIPLRYYPEQPPAFSPQDIILTDGDIVMIQSRDSEKYYTGGAVQGGEQAIPRDYDLTILAAIAKAGGSVGPGGTGISSIGGNQGGNQGFRGNGGGGGIGPSRAIVVRKTCTGQTIAIRVDLKKAITDSSENILVQPEDMIIVQYTLCEEVTNVAMRMLQFNYLLNR